MADFDLVVGVDAGLSYGEMQKGIAAAVRQINSNPPKIKIEIDPSSKSKIDALLGQFKNLEPPTVKGGSYFGNLQTEIGNISRSLEALKTEISSVSQAFKSFEGFNFKLDLGVGNAIKRNADYGAAARKTIPELRRQAAEIEAIFKTVYNAADGQNAVVKAMGQTGLHVSEMMHEIFPNLGDTNASMKSQMAVYERYINIMKEIAAARGIDISSAIKKDATEMVAATNKIQSGEAQLESGLEKIKNLFGGGINAEALAEQINTIVTAIDRVVEAISKISIDKDAFAALTESVQTSTTAVNGLVEALGKVNAGTLGSKAAASAQKADAISYQDATRAVKEYYATLALLSKTKGHDLTLDGSTWKSASGNYNELAAALNRTKTAYDLVTNSMNSMPAEKMASLQELITKEANSYNIALEQQANREREVSEAAAKRVAEQTKASEVKNRDAISYQDATRAVREYYDALNRLRQAKGNDLLLTDSGWRSQSGNYNELATALNRTKTAYDLVTNSMSSMPADRQAALLELMASESKKYALALEQQANKEREAAEASASRAADQARTAEVKKQEAMSYKDAERAIREYYDIQNKYRQAKGNDIVLTASGWKSESGHYDELAAALNRTKTAYDLVTRSMSSMPADHQAALAELMASEAQKYNLALEQQANKEREVAAAAREKAAAQEAAKNAQKEVAAATVYNQATQLRNMLGNGVRARETPEYQNAERWLAGLDTAINAAAGDASKLQAELSKIGINGTKDFEQVKQAVAALKNVLSTMDNDLPLEAGSPKYEKTIQTLTEMRATIQKNASLWTAARGGRSAGSYQEYIGQLQEIDSLLTKIDAKEISGKEAASSIAKIRQAMASASAEIYKAGEATRSFGDKLKGIASRFSAYFGISQIFMYSIRAMKEAVSASIQLESAFAQLKIVTGATDAEMVKFKDSAIGLAQELGKSVSDVAGSIEVFSRLGYSLPDASELAKYATIMSNVAAVDTDAATTGITSIIKGFDMDVENAEHVSDVLVKVGQEYAVSAGEMMTAFEKSGAALNATGTSFEKSAGLIAAANAAVQDAAVVGTALKTVSARIRGSKTDLEELGEGTEDLAEGFSKYAAELKGLTGFDIMNGDHTFKDLYDIMEGISRVWDKLSDTQRARVSEILGGTRQLQVISSILGNWEDAAGAYASAMDSAGAATRANDIYMSTAEAHINQMKAAFQAMSSTVFDSSIISSGADLVSFLLDGVSAAAKLVEALGGVKTILAAIVALNINSIASSVTTMLGTLTVKLTQMLPTEMILNIATSISKGSTIYKAFVSEVLSGSKSIRAAFSGIGKGIKSWFGGLSPLTKVSMGITGLIAVISLVNTAIDAYKRKIQEARNAEMEKGKASTDEAKNLAELYSAYRDAKAAYDGSADSKNALSSASANLAKALGVEKNAVNDLGNSYQELTLKQLRAAEGDARAAIIAARGNLNNSLSGKENGDASTLAAIVASSLGKQLKTGDSKRDAQTLMEVYDELIKRRDAMIAAGQEESSAYLINSQAIDVLRPNVEALVSAESDLNEIMSLLGDAAYNASDSIDRVGDSASKANGSFKELFSGSVSESIDSVQTKISTLSDALTKLETGSMGVEDVIDLLQQFPELAEYVDLTSDGFGNLDSALKSAISDAPNDLVETLEKFKETHDLTEVQTKQIDSLSNALRNLPKDSVKSLGDEFGVLADNIRKAGEAETELQKKLSEEDYDAGYDERVKNYEAFAKAAAEGEYGSKAYAAYSEYFGLMDKTAAEVDTWLAANKKYFTEGKEGIIAWTEELSRLTKSGDLDGIASYDENGLFTYDITKLDELAEKFGWTEAMMQDFISKYRMYVSDWESYSAFDLSQMFKGEGVLTATENGIVASVSKIMEYTGKSKEEVQELIDMINNSPDLASKLDLRGLQSPLITELEELGKGGAVDVKLRPSIDPSLLEDVGWTGLGDGVATLFTGTYSNEDETVAVNFTPIIADENGNYIGALSPEQLQKYAEGVIAGTREDDLHLQVGTEFKGEDAIEKAVEAANRIHEIHMELGEPIKLVDDTFLKEFSSSGFSSSLDEMNNDLRGLRFNMEELGIDYIELSKNGFADFDELAAPVLEAIGWTEDEIDALREKLQDPFDILFSTIGTDEIDEVIAKFHRYNIDVEVNDNGGVTITQEIVDNLQAATGNASDTLAIIDQLAGRGDVTIEAGIELQGQDLDQLLQSDGVVTVSVMIDDQQVQYAVQTTAEAIKTTIGDAGVITLTGDTTDIDTKLSLVNDVLTGLPSSEQPAIVSVSGETADAVTSLQDVIDQLAKIKSKSITITTTYNEIKTKHAKGTKHAKRGPALLGDEYSPTGKPKPELVVSKDSAYVAGVNGPVVSNLEDGDVVYTADETKKILKGSNIVRLPAFAGGTANGLKKNGSSGTSVSSYSGSGSKSTTAAAKEAAKDVSEAIEDQLKELKEKIDDILAQFEFDIFMAEKHNASSEEIIAIYKRMQQTVHEQAEKYRSMGVDENNEYIRDLKKQWWEYEESIREARKKEFDEWVKDSRFAIEVMEHDEDGVDKILDSWRTILRSINDEIAYYSAQGYDITSDEIQDLMKEAWDAEEQIEDILDSVLDKINDDIDKIQDVYKTFRTAAEEWDSSNYLTLDTLQEIIGLGVEYMACLRNENGALMINRQKIAEMLAAKAQELAIQGALNYVRKIGIALQEGETAELNRLLNATVDVTSATWGLVNANLAFLNLSRDQYDAAVENIDRLHSLANNVSKNILDSLKADGATSSIEDAGEGLEKIIDYTKDLIKHEHDDMAKALDDQLDKYKQIVDEKKKSLDLTKSELDYNKDISNRTTEIAKLQAQADALARDNSREAQLKRAKILEEIAKKQEELEEKQRDHSIDAQKEALDKQVENYEESIGKQKEELEKEISSEEKLYQLALKRLEESGMSEAFMDQLLAWNYEYGNSLNTEIVDAWDAAKRAVEAYGGSVKEALSHHGDTAEEKEIGDQVGVRETFDNPDAYAIARAMEANSLAWFSASSSERKRLEAENAKYASQLQDLGLYRQNGAWYREDGSQLYALDTAKVDQALAAAMKQNSIAWWTASPAERTQLANKNKELAGYSGGRITNQNGTWVGQDGKPLYTITAQEKEGIVHQLVAMMKSNSGAWASADATERKRLSEENVRLANSVGSLLGTKVTRGDDGVWMINGEKLYDKYHSGGVVGGGTIKDRERFALLNKGEMVLSDAQKQSLEHLLAVGQMLRDKSSLLADSVFGGMVNNIAANSMKGIRNQLPGEINKPTQIVHVDASLTVSGAVDDDVLRVIKRHPSFVAEQVAKVLV